MATPEEIEESLNEWVKKVDDPKIVSLQKLEVLTSMDLHIRYLN